MGVFLIREKIKNTVKNYYYYTLTLELYLTKYKIYTYLSTTYYHNDYNKRTNPKMDRVSMQQMILNNYYF